MSNNDKQVIQKYCQKYNYGYRIFDNDAIVTTNVDEWRISFIEDTILVQHLNKAGNRTRKCNYHTQRYAPDIEYVFDVVIRRHENYDSSYSEAFKIKNILEELKLA